MLVPRMAFRNVFRQRRRSLLTGLSIFGGFVLATIFIGFSDGTYTRLIDQITRFRLGHIQIHEATYPESPSLYKTLDHPERLEQILRQTPGVAAWVPRVFAFGLASVGNRTATVRIRGIDPQSEEKATRISARLCRGQMLPATPRKEVLLGQKLARKLGASPGTPVVVVSQGADGSIANERYRVCGLLDSGDEMENQTDFVLHLRDAQELLSLGDRIHEVAITLKQLKQVAPVVAALQAQVNDPRLLVEPWQSFARSFYVAMKADQDGMWFSLLIIVLVVAIGVFNTVLMSVLERRREYGVLKALGTRPRQVVSLVLLEVMILALLSLIPGILVGIGANAWLSDHGLGLGTSITYGGITFDRYVSDLNPTMFLIPMATILITAFLVGLFPALMAARTEPARTMRHF